MALTVHHAPSSTVPGWVVAGKDQRCFPAGNSGYGRVSQFCISPLLKTFLYFFNSIYCVYYSFLNYFLYSSFGWHRAEVIGATVSVLMIWVVTGILVFMAIQRIISMDFELDTNIMLVTSGIGVIMNIM